MCVFFRQRTTYELRVSDWTSDVCSSDGPAWTRMLAGIVHWLFYLVMILGPVTGWLLVSTARVQVPTLLYGLLPWPHLPVGRALHEPAEAIHGAMAWLAIGLFLLHIIDRKSTRLNSSH